MLETVNGEAGGSAPGVTPGFRQGKGMKARLGETAWLQAGCGVRSTESWIGLEGWGGQWETIELDRMELLVAALGGSWITFQLNYMQL